MNPRVLVIVAILIVLIAVVVAFLLPGIIAPPAAPANPDPNTGQVPPPAQENALPTPTPIQFVEIVIAVQEMPRGFRIPPNAIQLAPYPADSAPFNAIQDPEDVIGKIARTDIGREQPILSNLIVEDLTEIAAVGSDAAAVMPSNLVAVSIPIDRLTSVAYAIQDGDRVDLIMSMLFVDVDEVFQTILPNEITLFNIAEDGTINFLDGIAGRPDTSSFGPVILSPAERQRPRLVTQRTVQDAFVVHIGNFPIGGQFIGIPPTPTPVPVDDEEVGQGTPPPPTPTPPRPDIITLAVPPQEAVVLVWAIEAKIPISLALRAATNDSRVPTDPVTMDYVMQEYNITLPVKRNFAIEPAIRSIRQLVASDEISLSSE
jgi:pilus assembly protein CpaB